MLDEKELHICLLKLYDKLNAKLPCHVRVPRQEEVTELFQRYAPAGGALDEEQFIEVAQDVLASDRHWHESIIVKVLLTVGLQVALFPLVGESPSYLAVLHAVLTYTGIHSPASMLGSYFGWTTIY